LGELSWWLRLAGEHRPASTPLAAPFALMLAGEHRGAAAAWEALGCPLWAAYALALSAETRDAQEGLDILTRLDAPAVRHAVLRKLGEPTRSRAVAAALRLGVIAPR